MLCLEQALKMQSPHSQTDSAWKKVQLISRDSGLLTVIFGVKEMIPKMVLTQLSSKSQRY